MQGKGTTDQPDAGASVDEAGLLRRVLDRMAALETQVAEFNRRSSHREGVIDRLHAENQDLRAGIQRVILEPAVADLIRLHGGLSREADRAPDEPSAELVRSFAGDVEMILDRCGLELFTAEPGDPYRPGDHRPVAVVPTDDPGSEDTIAEVVAAGFREREGGRVRGPVQVRVHRHQPKPDHQPRPGRDGATSPIPATRRHPRRRPE
jgi:molecular chaperone GrpE